METKNKYKMTEIGEIPVDWEDTNFLNVFKPIPSKKHQIPNKDILDSGCYEVVDQGKNGIAGYSNQTEKLFEDVPAIIYGDHTTIVKYRKKPFVLGADGTKLLKVKEHYNAEYCYYLLNHFNISPEGYKRHYSIVKEVKFPLTNNIKEQQKIAEILSTVDEQIDQTDQLIEKTKELKKGLMQQLLTKGIGHSEFKQYEMGEIPVEWNIHIYGSITQRITVGIATSTTKHYVKNGIPMIRNQNIKNNKIIFNDLLYISSEFDEKNKSKRLKENDIITVRTGYPGQSAVVPKELENAQSFTTLISTPNKDIINSEYLSYYINSPIGMEQLKNMSAGGAQQNLNAASLRKLKVILPSLKEQQEIAEIISSVDEDIEGYEEEKSKYEELKKGLMQQLLTGKTRVKVD